MSEPLIHSHIEDVLDDTHQSAFKNVWCGDCHTLVHASNNECMTTWVESGEGDFCLTCFAKNHNTGGTLNWRGTREEYATRMKGE